MGHAAAEIHADRTQGQRTDAMRGFKTGKFRVLVATDIAARGIDVTDIELVINYDLPDDIGNYVHRIGRTGRAGKPGHAITFATPEQRDEVNEIERFMRAAIPVSRHSNVPTEEPTPPPKAAEPKPAFGRSPRPSRRRLRGGR
jgi:ATP-dependent RNA helicase RhlE